jgi:hypothetical protein
MDISKEVFEHLTIEFMLFAFNEMQTEGWTERRQEYCDPNHLGHYAFDHFQMDTFPNIMRTVYNGDLDKTLFHFFSNEITRRGWFSSFCVKQNAEIRDLLNAESIENIQYMSWWLGVRLTRWMWVDMEEFKDEADSQSEKMRSILGLDICLK